jgi:hypothetical protein
MLQKLFYTFDVPANERGKSERECSIMIFMAPDIQLPPGLDELKHPLPITREQLQKTASQLDAAIYVDNEENQSTLLPKTIFTLALNDTLLFVNSSAKILDELLPGYEVEGYTSLSDLINKLDFYRTNEQEYQRIVKGARTRVLRDHSPEARAYAFLCKLGAFDQTTPRHVLPANTGEPQSTKTDESAIAVSPGAPYVPSAGLFETEAETPQKPDQLENLKDVVLQSQSVDLFTGMDLAKAIDLFNQNNPTGALEIINKLISHDTHVPGIHLFRARCIALLEGPTQRWLARNAMREELRQSVDHQANKAIVERTALFLKPIEDEDFKRRLPINEHLFEEWYSALRDFSTLPKTTLYSIYRRARLMVVRDVPGDLIDIGCGDGGVALLLEKVVKKFSRIPRRVIALDSFKGLTSFDPVDTLEGKLPGFAGWGKGTHTFSLERTMKTLSAFESEVRLKRVNLETREDLEMIFAELKKENRSSDLDFALVHIDVSTYKPTQHCLETVYPFLNLHGSLVVERGIGIEGVGHAINEFLSENQADFRFVGEECDTIWIAPKKGYGWTDSRVSTYPEYL